MPVRSASAAWRSRWTASRDRLLVIAVARAGSLGDLAVEGERGFQGDERELGANPAGEIFVQVLRLFFSNAADHLNSGAAKFCEALAGNGGIGVAHGGDDALHSGGDDGFCAGAGAAGGAAGFESDVESGAARILSGLFRARRFRRGRDGRNRGSLRRRLCPFLTSTAPTIGFGCARACAAIASVQRSRPSKRRRLRDAGVSRRAS